MSLAANVSRGFRAPDITDLGTFGLTGSGYEVSNREVAGLGATVGSTADAAAVSTGRAVEVLAPETSLSYELTVRYRSRRLKADVTGFQTDVDDNIAKQTLILPAGAVGLSLAGEPVTRQLDTGAVFVSVSSNPVLVFAALLRPFARARGSEILRRWRSVPSRNGCSSCCGAAAASSPYARCSRSSATASPTPP